MTPKAKLNNSEVAAGYRAGLSIRDLAAKHAVSVRPIQRILQEEGVEMRPTGVRGPDRAPRLRGGRGVGQKRSVGFTAGEQGQIVALFASGQTQRDIARRFGCSASTVVRVLRQAGIEPGAHGQMRERHHAWKGGRQLRPDGYVLVRAGRDDPIAHAMEVNGYVLEHRLVMAHALGRALTSNEYVHHINGDRGDNRLENLQLRFGPHGKGAAMRCEDCGSENVMAIPLDEAPNA